MIYNYLFYKGFQLAKKSKNWDDTPVLFAMMIIAWCFVLNFATLIFLIEGVRKKDVGLHGLMAFFNNYRYVFGGVVLVLLGFYYGIGKRWERIIEKYDAQEATRKINIHPGITVVIAYILSFICALIAAMYKNGDGLFGNG